MIAGLKATKPFHPHLCSAANLSLTPCFRRLWMWILHLTKRKWGKCKFKVGSGLSCDKDVHKYLLKIISHSLFALITSLKSNTVTAWLFDVGSLLQDTVLLLGKTLGGWALAYHVQSEEKKNFCFTWLSHPLLPCIAHTAAVHTNLQLAPI